MEGLLLLFLNGANVGDLVGLMVGLEVRIFVGLAVGFILLRLVVSQSETSQMLASLMAVWKDSRV